MLKTGNNNKTPSTPFFLSCIVLFVLTLSYTDIDLRVVLKLGATVAWFAGTAFIPKRDINDPKTLIRLFNTVVLPSGVLVKWICEDSILCVLQANDLQGLHTLWQNYKSGTQVLITEDLRNLTKDQEIILDVV